MNDKKQDMDDEDPNIHILDDEQYEYLLDYYREVIQDEWAERTLEHIRRSKVEGKHTD